MVSPTLPSVHPWVTMVPTSSAAAVEVWSLISFISSRGLVRMRDLRKLRWGKERGPAGSFSSPDQLGARWSDKNIGKTQDVTRRHKTVSKLQCQQTQFTALQSYKYNLPKCLSKCRQSKISNWNCFYVYVSFITVWDFVSKCLKQSHISTFCCICTRAQVTQWQIQKKMSRYDMISDDRYRSQKWMSLNMFVSVPLYYRFFLSSVSQRCVKYFLFS